MSTNNNDVRAALDAQISGLEQELARLRAARVALAGGPVPAMPAAAGSSKSPRRRLSREDSMERAWQCIAANPGIEGSKLGPTMGLSLSAGYRVLNRLSEAGLIHQNGNGWEVVDDDSPAEEPAVA